MAFKKDFAWGVATASYQIEGAYNEDGKGLNLWDVFTHEDGRIFMNHTGDVACDHYHLYKEDIKLMAELGIKAYRFSISWTRLFPNGDGELNEKGAAYYSDLIDELLKYGIEPYITLFHWDYPYALYQRGGWMNDDSVKWFADYAREVIRLYSDRVTYFITFNEPQCFIGQGFEQGIHAPAVKLPHKDIFKMCHNVLKAHGAAVIAMREAAVRPIKIGYAPTSSAHYPSTDSPEDIEAAKKVYFGCEPISDSTMWNVSWWSDPVMLGEYPAEGLELYKDHLPVITEEDMELIHQPLDFYCQNIYNGCEIRAGENGEPEFVERKPGYLRTALGWPVTPECLRWGPRFLYERYKLPVIISENGMAAHDWISLDGKVHDPNRIDFIERYLNELEKATEDGVDVGGYFLWTFTDNFEWTYGYSQRLGIVHIDFETQKRTVKDSGYWYRDWIKKHE